MSALSSFQVPAARAKATVPPVHRVEAHLARRFHQICLGALAEVTEPDGLSPVEYAILGSLDDAPGIDQRRLASRIGIDPVSAHHIVERLEGMGLIDRQVDPADRRARTLRLTAKGVRLRRHLRPKVIAAQDQIMRTLSKSERHTLLELLTRVVEANQAYARPGNGRRAPTRKASV
jgi:MarR family transcriptional regulator, temperature-dependent positive regulator of motility